MRSSHTQIYIHAVFAVNYRYSLIRPVFKRPLYQYIQKIFRDGGHALIAIGGMPDHMHLLFRLKPTRALSGLIRDVKAHSSRFVNESGLADQLFYWQKGYGAFSCSHAQVEELLRTISDQEAYHQTKTFKEEYLEYFGELNIAFERGDPYPIPIDRRNV